MPNTLIENHSTNMQNNLAKEKAWLLQNQQRLEQDLAILNGTDAGLICSSFFPNGDKFEGSKQEKLEKLLQMQKDEYAKYAACVSSKEIKDLKDDPILQNFFYKISGRKQGESKVLTLLGYLEAVAQSRVTSPSQHTISNLHFKHWNYIYASKLEEQEKTNMGSICRKIEEYFLFSDIKRQMVLLEKNSSIQKNIQDELAQSIKNRLIPVITADLEVVTAALSQLNSDMVQEKSSQPVPSSARFFSSEKALKEYYGKENIAFSSNIFPI